MKSRFLEIKAKNPGKKETVDLKYTGERFIPSKCPKSFYVENIQRYKFTEPFIKNKIVLDAGCGEGYGSDYLAQISSKVIGIDIDEEVIGYAKKKYKKIILNLE